MKKKIKRLIEELKNEVSDQVDRKSLDKLKISFGLNSRRVLGSYRRKGRVIFINAPLLCEIGFKKYKPIIIHEFAHFVIGEIHPKAAAHGPEWKRVVRSLGGIDKARTTEYSLNIQNIWNI